MGMMDLNLRPTTRTTLRPDYEKMISSSYALQTAENRRALAATRTGVGQPVDPEAYARAIKAQREQVFGGLGKLAESFGQAYGQARQANEARYQQMLRISGQETARQAGIQERMLGVVGRTTGQREADIRGEYAGRESDIMQQLGRQGMAGTTIAPTMRMGVEREKQSALNRLADTMQGTRLGVLGQMAAPREAGRLGIMERRTDAYPDPTALTSAAGAIGEGYGGPGMAAMLGALSKTYQ